MCSHFTLAYYNKYLMIDAEKYDLRRDLSLLFLADALYSTYLYHTDRDAGWLAYHHKYQVTLHRTLRVRYIKRCRDIARNGSGNLDGLLQNNTCP